MKSLVRLVVCFLLLLSSFHLFSQLSDPSNPDSIPVYLQKQIELFPQEKIYAQLDKASYIAGEDVWFRIYLVNAATHLPKSGSRYVYVELINSEEGILERIKIKEELGIFRGYVTLPENLKNDTYHLRFYTKYMDQIGEDYFFYRSIQVGTLASTHEKEKKKESIKGTDFDVRFLPEGGVLPMGVSSQIAFKAIHREGLGEDIMGIVVDSKGDTITHFSSQHLGMGKFPIRIDSDDKYYAICRSKTGLEKRFQLPQAEKNVQALNINWLKNNLLLSVKENFTTEKPQPFYLVGTCRRLLFYLDQWDPAKDFISIPDSILPTGVLQWMLIDRNHNPVSERLTFHLGKNEKIQTSFFTEKNIYEAKERVSANLFFTDNQQSPLSGNFSVSVTDDRDVLPDSCITLLSTLLLASELQGNIEDPNYYFRNTHPAVSQHLDLLMMTQGWSRYRIANVLKGEYQIPSTGFEIAQSISGSVIGGTWMNKPVENYPVSLLSVQDMFFQETKTDQNGLFIFDDLEFIDSCCFVIQSMTHKGNTQAVISLDPDFQAALQNIYPSDRENDTVQFKNYLNKADNQLLLTKGIRTINLSDVIVKAPRIQQERGKSVFSTGFGKRYTSDDIKKSTYTDIYTFLMTIPGVRVSGAETKITTLQTNGELSFGKENSRITSMRSAGAKSGEPPLLVVNDVKMELSYLESLQIGDIAEIEFVIGGSAAILGPVGVQRGALLITLKNGREEEIEKKIKNISILQQSLR